MRHFFLIPALFMAGSLSAFASVDSGLLALVPAGAKMISGVDVTRLRNSEFGQYLLSKSQAEDANFQTMIDQTGFDPRRDLQSMVFESSGAGAGGQASFAILARGNFDEQRIRALAKSHGSTIENFQGAGLIVNPGHGQRTAIGFPDVGIAVMADLATLKQILLNRASPTILDAKLQEQIDKAGAGNDTWFATSGGGDFLARHIQQETDDSSQPLPKARVLQSVQQASGGIHLGPMIQITFDAVTRSPQDATSLSDVVRFVGSMVQLKRQDDPRANLLAASIDKMTLETKGEAVHIAMSIPEKTLEQIAEAGAPVSRGNRQAQ